MKELLILKRIDFWLQPIAVVAPMIIGSIIKEPWLAMCIHFSLGGVQAVSCLLNRFFLQNEYRAGSRGLYELVLLIFAIIGVFALIAANGNKSGSEDFVIMYLLVMLVAGIVMGIWYMILSFKEYDNIERLIKQKETANENNLIV